MSVRPYAEMAESGLSWAPVVPAHWRVCEIKRIAALQSGDAITADRITEAGEYPVFGGGGQRGYTDAFTHEGRFALIGRQGALCGNVNYGTGKFWASEHAVVATPRVQLDTTWLGETLRAMNLNQYSVSAAQPGLSVDAVSRLRLPVPPVGEQRAIANFLDRETAKIDALVAEQERLMVLLREKRQGMISHAVTKGMSPDAQMNASGVDWLGDVPSHWTVGPIKRFMRSLNPQRIPLSSEERSHRQGEYPYYGASGIIDSVDAFLFDGPTVLVSEDGANLLGRATPIAFVADGRYWVNNHAHILQPPDDACRFWAERIECVDVSPFVTGSAQPKLTSEALMNLTIAIPPTPEERIAIAERIEHEEASLAPLIHEASRATDLLRERRSALITAAVTGQIDVRHLATTDADAA